MRGHRAKNILRQIVVALILIGMVSCASLERQDQPAPTPPAVKDPWHGRYRHFSGKYDLVLNHFRPDSIAVDIVELPEAPGQRPRAMFFAMIKNANKAIFEPKDEPDCRFELRQVAGGIMVPNLCNGTGEDSGLNSQ